MKKLKHIVLVGNTSWGMYNFRKGLIVQLVNEGFVVSVVAPQDQVFSEKLKSLGCNYVPIYIDGKGVNIFKDARLIYDLLVCYNSLKPDLIFHYTIKPNIYGCIAARILNIPSIAVITGLGYTFLKKNIITWLVQRLYKISLKSAKQVWFLNRDDRDIFVAKRILEPSRTFILNGEGINSYNYSPIRKLSNEKSFLLIARLLWDKGVGEFVDAASVLRKKYPSVQFNLLGYLGVKNPSAIDPALIESWKSKGIIDYLGATEDVVPFIADSTCVVLPSYREGLSRVLLEATAMERPVIATNIAGCKEIVEHGVNGFLCDVKSVDSLIEQMEKIILLSDEALEKMGKNGREKVIKEFDEKIIINEYLKTIGYLLDVSASLESVSTKKFKSKMFM